MVARRCRRKLRRARQQCCARSTSFKSRTTRACAARPFRAVVRAQLPRLRARTADADGRLTHAGARDSLARLLRAARRSLCERVLRAALAAAYVECSVAHPRRARPLTQRPAAARVEESVAVDTRHAVGKLPVLVDLTFPGLPCDNFGLDAVDTAGEQQLEVSGERASRCGGSPAH